MTYFVVKNYRMGSYYSEERGPREFTTLDQATHYKTFDEAMHVVRMFPSLDLCVSEVNK